MTEYRTLEKTPFEDIHKSFMEAFADYFVQMAPAPDALRRMNALRGVDYSASLGAFEDGRLIGFTLNGVGPWNGRPTAYDAGTGVVKAFRGRGISKEIFRRLRPVLRGGGVERCLLEVITANEGAVKLYKGLGFEVTRKFLCVKLKPGALRAPAGAGVTVADLPAADWPAFRRALEKDAAFLPSWQNSWDSILRLPDYFTAKGVYRNGEPAACAVAARASGSIAQLWVESGLRRAGLGSALLRSLAASTGGGGALSWVNIDDRAEGTLKFLEAAGFEPGLSQYEMEMGV